jgi:RND family efflux transporter MFP subunit
MIPNLHIPRQVSVPILVLVIGVAVAGYFVGSRPRASLEPLQEKVWSVAVVEAIRRDVKPKIRVFGEILAGREAEIRAMVAGQLVELNPEFRNGTLIVTGTMLAVIDPTDYELGLAERRSEQEQALALVQEYERELEWEEELLENAGLQVKLAKRGLERMNALALDGRESKKARDDAEMTLSTARQGELQRAQATVRLRARIKQQRAAYERVRTQLATAERELSHTRVVAPFDGYIADVKLALGQRVAVGETLGRLIAATELEARFEVPEADFARLMQSGGGVDAPNAVIGREVDISWRLGEEVIEFKAVISRIGAEIDAAMGGIELFAVLAPDASRAGLRVGAFVEIDVQDVEYESVFLLPAKAVSDAGHAYILDGDRLKIVDVTVLRRFGGEVLVEAAFEEGSEIITNQFSGIGPGLKARAL